MILERGGGPAQAIAVQRRAVAPDQQDRFTRIDDALGRARQALAQIALTLIRVAKRSRGQEG
jgi:hypothetical protein